MTRRALVVVDMQDVFADPASPWATPAYARAADGVRRADRDGDEEREALDGQQRAQARVAAPEPSPVAPVAGAVVPRPHCRFPRRAAAGALGGAGGRAPRRGVG